MPRAPRTVELGDGRRVAYELYGVEDGAPLVLLHGFSDSRLTGAVFETAARRVGTRLVVPDRPGIGLSTGRLGSLADCGAWLAAFVERLGLSRVPLAAVSGGGPFALACARFAAERLERVLVVSGLGPPEQGYAGMPRGQQLAIAVARRAPGLGASVLAGVATLARISPRAFLALVGTQSSESDTEAIRGGGSVELLARPFVEAYRQGRGGVENELRLLLHPWGFRPEEIALPVRFEHGADDATVPPDAARQLCRRIPNAVLSIREGVGHFSLAPRYADELLAFAHAA